MKANFGEKTRKNITAFSFIMCLVVVGAMGIYYQYMKRQQLQTEVHTPTTEVEKLIAKDLEVGYPETPTEVMKLWGRINQCIYNTALDDEEFDALLGQLRAMYSKELLEQNPENAHKNRLQEEVKEFQADKNKIVSYSAETGNGVKYKTINNQECADIRISYFINNGSGYVKNFQDFILVKEDGKWKIQGFKDVQTEKSTEKEATSQ
ncbi:MAG: hypothetical protein J1F02_08870 [Lachnospiraceae bacterium]|nr:hypothetical protein [Lachnospiraceae bacterium]